MPASKVRREDVADEHQSEADERSSCGDIRDDLEWTNKDDDVLGPTPSRWEPRRSASSVMMQKPGKENESSASARLMQIKRACGDRPAPTDSWGRSLVATVDGWRQLSRRSLNWTRVTEHRKGYG
jgi:hypothetical protein